MKKLLLALLAISPIGCIASPKEAPSCATEQISIEYQGIQQLYAWNRQIDFGTFALSNNAIDGIRLPLDGSYYPLIIHGAHVQLQSRPAASGAWEADIVVLEHFAPPSKWLVIGPGDGTNFFVDMVGPLSDQERTSSREYRISLKDASGCQYFSGPFRVGI